jgi:formamidopyrimidine-DNA glycosylase
MLELPEVITIARQMNAELRGKRIIDAVSGTSPYKFAFYNHPAKTYAEVLRGKTVGG